jgi:hypothetical protein
LGILKSLGKPLRTFLDALDAEIKRRAFEENEIIDGYQIGQRSGTRTIEGSDNIGRVIDLLRTQWQQNFPAYPLDWEHLAFRRLKIEVTELEKAAAAAAPKGLKTKALLFVSDQLRNLNVITASKFPVLVPTQE